MDNRKQLPLRFIFAGQFQHLLFLALLVPGAVYLARPALDGGTFIGVTERQWFWTTIAVAVGHQVIVWFVFRTQLSLGLFSRLFGAHDLTVWGAIFIPFLVLRPLTILALGLADEGSLGGPRLVYAGAALILLAPALYTGYSVGRYFGVRRALGGDHFRQRYREMPLVRQGAFRYSTNAMYTFAFLGLWAAALLLASRAALAAALFQHAYIWVHWYGTEQPDMATIYGSG